MVSIPQFCYDRNFFSDFCEFQSSAMGGGSSVNGTLWPDEDSLVPNSAFDNDTSDQILHPNGFSASLLNMVVPQLNVGDVHGIDGFSVLNEGYQEEIFQLGDEWCGFMQNLKPIYPAGGEHLGFQSDRILMIEESKMKVCRYTKEERKERIVRYLKKRSQRNFNKTIKYACRKTLADRRVRVQGRFAKHSESPTTHHHSQLLYPCDVVQIKQDEDCLQDITNFMYLPYIPTLEHVYFAF